MAIAQHHGRPNTPTDQAWIESFFGHIKGEWPHLEDIADPVVLETKPARVPLEYNTVRHTRPSATSLPTTSTTGATTTATAAATAFTIRRGSTAVMYEG